MDNLRHLLREPCLEDYDLEAGIWGELNFQGRERLRTVLEAAMETELSQRLGYHPYQRDPEIHTNYRNGYYRREIDTQFGPIHDLRVPRPRQGGARYTVLERYARRAPWVNDLVAEMFLAGVSTRRVGQIVESLLEASVSASTVSRIASRLDEQVRAWQTQTLEDKYEYLILDGVTLKIKTADGAAKRLALCVYGITPKGQREMISFRLAKSEAEAEWIVLLEDLRTRGLSGKRIQLAVTDGGQGLINALQFVFPWVPLQRCWAHKLRNVSNRLKTNQRTPCLKEAAGIYQAAHRREATRRYRTWKSNWQSQAPEAVACLQKDIESLLAFFSRPLAHRKKIRTTNAIERQFREVRRRTNPMTCFSNEQSANRILYAIFQYANTQWAESLLEEFTQKN